MDIFKSKKIIIIGNNGSGKSYLSKELSEITGLPLVHLDMLYWRPNWEAPSRNEWLAIQKELISKDEWIIDGNHTETMELRFEAADLIIFLDLNRIVCLASVLKRHSKERTDSPQYLEYKLDKAFLEFCKRLWSFSNTRKPIIISLHDKYADKPFYIIKNRRTMNKLLHNWRNEKRGK